MKRMLYIMALLFLCCSSSRENPLVVVKGNVRVNDDQVAELVRRMGGGGVPPVELARKLMEMEWVKGI